MAQIWLPFDLNDVLVDKKVVDENFLSNLTTEVNDRLYLIARQIQELQKRNWTFVIDGLNFKGENANLTSFKDVDKQLIACDVKPNTVTVVL